MYFQYGFLYLILIRPKFAVNTNLRYTGGARDLVDQLMEGRGAGQEGQGLPNTNLRYRGSQGPGGRGRGIRQNTYF